MTERVAIFLPSLRGGGAERMMVRVAQGLSRLGHPVDLVVCNAEGPVSKEVPPDVRVVDLEASRVALSLPHLVKYLKAERPDSLLSTLGHSNISAILAKKLARVDTRVVVRVANTTTMSTIHSPTMGGRWIPYGERMSYPKAASIIAISKGVADDLVKNVGVPTGKVRVIYNPVVTPTVLEKSKEKVDHPWFSKGQVPVVLGAGRLTEQKDFPTLVRAFSVVREQMEARLVVLGEGNSRQRIESLVQDLGLEKDVWMPGYVENAYKYMRRSSLFVQSPRWEGFGNVLVEAMSVGTPVVSTDCPNGPREILENGKWGRLVPVQDAQALADAILATFVDQRRPDVSARAQAFDADRSVAMYQEVLTGALDARDRDVLETQGSSRPGGAES